MNATTETANGTDRTAVSQMRLKLYVLDNFEEAYPIQAAWDSAVEKTGSDIFLSFDWCRIWWKYYGDGRKLELLLFKRENEIAGIIPLYLDRIRVGPLLVRVWKIVGCDFTLNTFCLPIEADWINEIAGMFLSYYEKKSGWDIIFVGPISGFYPNTEAICTALSANKRPTIKVVTNQSGKQSILHPKSTWDEYFGGLGPKTRRNIRKTYSQLQKERLDIVLSFASTENLRELFKRFVSMHQSKWEKENRAGFFKSWPLASEFHSELSIAQAEKGRLLLMEVLAGKMSMGFSYSYKIGQVQSYLLMARPMDLAMKGVDAGKIIWCEVVRKAIADSAKTIDLMRGSYDYKTLLGAAYLPIHNIYVMSRGWQHQVRIALIFKIAYIVNLLYARLWRNKVAPLLSSKQKELWSLWIKTHWFGERAN